jgi:MFS family permease
VDGPGATVDRRAARALVLPLIAGFATTAVGMILLLTLVRANSGILTWVPGLLLFGAGVGVMLTSSVNVVQSSFPEADQGEISGLSRSASNLGSSLGTALVGSVLVAVARPAGQPFAVALAIMLVLALIGLVIAVLIPRQSTEAAQQTDPSTAAARQVHRPQQEFPTVPAKPYSPGVSF